MATGRSAAELLKRFLLAREQAKNFSETRNQEDLPDVGIQAGNSEPAVRLFHALESKEEHPETRAVDKIAPAEVDENVAFPAMDVAENLLLEHADGLVVDFSRNGDDEQIVLSGLIQDHGVESWAGVEF